MSTESKPYLAHSPLAPTLAPAWQQLSGEVPRARGLQLHSLFAQNPDRARQWRVQAAELLFDYSRHLLDQPLMDLLLDLARQRQLPAAIQAMFSGANVNNTEDRPALHVALRNPDASTDQEQQVQATLARITRFVTAVQEGDWLGYAGDAITDIVNIGIGGSDLGPAMAYQALAPYHTPGIQCHFVSNVDPAHLRQTLLGLRPETTLFVIASKSFTTLETAKNAEAAREWILAHSNEAALPRHFVAVSTNLSKAAAFGIAEDNIFPMWDWVGGRYSMWSAIGLPVALGVGMDSFRSLLDGAHAMDLHFRDSPLAENLPVIMALLAVWYLNFLGAQSQVVLPYAQNLHLFPAFLQQLDMESLGKSVMRNGLSPTTATGGIIWGSAGTNGQHSFHQLLHQGTHLIPADFIATARSHYNESPLALEQHQHLLANCLSQSQALMEGKSLAQAQQELMTSGMDEASAMQLAPHKVIPGNRPSSLLLMPQLTPQTLGSLIAAYEHKVFCQSVLLGINAFDQWGVELGKTLSTRLFALMENGDTSSLDASTQELIAYYRAHR
jgi:glucose-6-phosphate isomerase